MTFTLAHFSDVHLGPVTLADILGDFRLKRIIGGCSWHFRRKKVHQNSVAQALRADVLATVPDHVCFTGDLVNIAAEAEFIRAMPWLAGFGEARNLTFVPGNHDAYVKAPFERGLGLFSNYMRGDGAAAEVTWPFVRLRRNIAIIGVTSALPQRLWKAGGTVGAPQLRDLGLRLADLGARGFYRVVMIHHPPLPGLARPRKALTDAAALQQVLMDNGAELVLHGHNHRNMFSTLKTRNGTAHVIGTASASIGVDHGHESAQWHAYRVGRAKGRWQTEVTIRGYDPTTRHFREVSQRMLDDAPQD